MEGDQRLIPEVDRQIRSLRSNDAGKLQGLSPASASSHRPQPGRTRLPGRLQSADVRLVADVEEGHARTLEGGGFGGDLAEPVRVRLDDVQDRRISALRSRPSFDLLAGLVLDHDGPERVLIRSPEAGDGFDG